MTKISESELEVMEAVWRLGTWVDIARVHKELSEDRLWAYNTVGTFMIRLEDKGFLTHEKRGKTNFYHAVVSREKYKQAETEKFLNQVHSGSKKSLIAALYHGQVEDEELDRLMQMLEEFGEED